MIQLKEKKLLTRKIRIVCFDFQPKIKWNRAPNKAKKSTGLNPMNTVSLINSVKVVTVRTGSQVYRDIRLESCQSPAKKKQARLEPACLAPRQWVLRDWRASRPLSIRPTTTPPSQRLHPTSILTIMVAVKWILGLQELNKSILQ